MAKKVTRTILETEATVLCLNTVTCEPCTEVVCIPGTYKNDEQVLKQVKKRVDTDELKAVSISATEVKETLYGMPEDDFIAHAVVLPPRAKKEETEKEN